MSKKVETIQPWQLEVGDKFDFAGSLMEVVEVGDTSLATRYIDVEMRDVFGLQCSMRLYHATPHMKVIMDSRDPRKLN